MNVLLLKAEMAKNNVTQESLAKAIGVSSNTLSRKMTGKRPFKVEEMLNICDFLHIEDPREIFLR